MVGHPVRVRAPKALLDEPAPLLLERTDARFMDSVRLELADPRKREQLLATRVQAKAGKLQLCQPIHRAFNLALIEVVCDTAQTPRLDPRKIESAGLVVRRVVERAGLSDAAQGGGRAITRRTNTRIEQAWMRSGAALQGWVDLNDQVGAVGPTDDPDAKRRVRRGVHPVLAQQLARMQFSPSALSESVAPLFVLPEEVCASAGATLLYGTVPTASLDQTKAEPAALFDATDVLADLPAYLRALPRGAVRVPNAGGVLTRPSGSGNDATLSAYAEFVERTIGEYDLFGDTRGADRLRATFDTVQLEYPSGKTKSLTEHLREVAAVLVYPPPSPTREVPSPPDARADMPLVWAVISPDQEALIVAAVSDILRHQIERLQSHEDRFGRLDARYIVRAFVRVRRDDGCPAQIFWSAPSEAFSIAPWYEPGRGPVPIVPLPDPFKDIGKFKPNVAFALPAAISDVVHRNTADKLLKGEGSRGPGLGLGWLCGFNIPLITLCAFIVLSIFLSLFQIIFWWLAFIRICIPIPVPKQNT